MMGYGQTELKGESHLQVAPNSNKFINPKNLLVSKTPNPPRSRGDKIPLAASGYAGFGGGVAEAQVNQSNESKQLLQNVREANN